MIATKSCHPQRSYQTLHHLRKQHNHFLANGQQQVVTILAATMILPDDDDDDNNNNRSVELAVQDFMSVFRRCQADERSVSVDDLKQATERLYASLWTTTPPHPDMIPDTATPSYKMNALMPAAGDVVPMLAQLLTAVAVPDLALTAAKILLELVTVGDNNHHRRNHAMAATSMQHAVAKSDAVLNMVTLLMLPSHSSSSADQQQQQQQQQQQALLLVVLACLEQMASTTTSGKLEYRDALLQLPGVVDGL
jgi:hypothetical protein